ncbi:hypothetical protein AB395_00002684 [Sinorhizobium fredii CCBAU 45436]|nr:hypothetical protein AB395_00002684 [Sinorhizobium fredii CCBAU 45436]
MSNSYRRSLLSTSSVVASVIGPTPKKRICRQRRGAAFGAFHCFEPMSEKV